MASSSPVEIADSLLMDSTASHPVPVAMPRQRIELRLEWGRATASANHTLTVTLGLSQCFKAKSHPPH